MYAFGKKNGQGKFEWSDGSYYEGELQDSLFWGQGTQYFAADEKMYEGSFAAGMFENKGRLTQKDGCVYEGDFHEGKKEGNGTMTWPSGRKYTGPWKNDLQHGIGVQYDPKQGTKMQGEWKEGKRTKWLSKPIKVMGENNRALNSAGSALKNRVASAQGSARKR